tara:strand:- start:80 stop:463 length:384 start_codon:yes stop_codon:yes gene_type:complete
MEFSQQTIQQMFNEYIAADDGNYFFNYTISKSQNVFVQGTSLDEDYELELTSEDYLIDPDVLDANRVQLLKELGWEIGGGAGMYVLLVSKEHLQNGDASSVVYHSLKAYNLLDHEIDFSGYQIASFS